MIVRDADKALEFYQKAFGAVQLMKPVIEPNSGKILHTEIKIGNTPIMLCDEFEEFGTKGPRTLGGSAIQIHLYVDDADSVAKQAVEAGATELIPVADQYYGDRSGRVVDPFGHVWIISTHREMLSHQDRQDRTKAFFTSEKTKAFLRDSKRNPLLGGKFHELAFKAGAAADTADEDLH